jgi:hypothetical protein
MPSNEALDLLESVLSSISESERWQYRIGDIREKQKERERKRVLMGKNDEEYNDIDTPTEDLELARKGIQSKDFKKSKYYRRYTPNEVREVLKNTLKSSSGYKGQGFSKEELDHPAFKNSAGGTYYIENEPEHKAMHDRINTRTELYDTTAKHEAAMILIEALNTLLNE